MNFQIGFAPSLRLSLRTLRLNSDIQIYPLRSIASKTSLQFNEDEVVFLGRMNDLQLEGRYPDYIKSIHKRYKLKEATQILKQTGQIRKCLLKSLQ